MKRVKMMVWCVLLMVLALLVGNQSTFGGVKNVAAQEEDSIASVASGEEELSILVEAVVAAGLLDAVADPEAAFTVFAPTNEAFLELLGGLGIDSLDAVPVELLQEVLLYHVVPAVAFSTDLSEGQVLPTLNGAELVVNLAEGVVIEGVGSDATVIFPDVAAGDSVVHVIDAVLLPFSTGGDAEEPVEEPAEEESIADVASGSEDLSILVEAVVAAGLLDAVADPEAEFTVFAPTNEAFVELLGALGLDGLDDVPVDLLQEVLLYHVVPAVAFSTDLTDGQVLPTLNGAELVVDLSSGVMIDGIGSDATVIFPDIEAGDSVVHVIDAVLLPFSTGGDAEESVEEPAEEESIADIASGAEDLSILVEAVVAAGLLDAVADPEAEFTVFAPTNEAFVELLGALGLDGLDDVPVDLLQEVLLYHVVPAVAFSTDLTDGQVLPTLNGAELVVDLSSGIVIDGIGSDATVLLPNIDAGDSVVHVIDAVLLPFSTDAEEPVEEPAEEESIAEVASDVSDLSILVEAVVAAGLLDAVADPEAELTVFAPTNDAFVELLGALGLDSLDDVPVDLLQQVLLYHVVPAVAFSTDLTDGQVLPTLDGENTLTVDIEDAGIFIDAIGSTAEVIFADVAAGNSVVHVIDAVLLPFEADAPDVEGVRQPLPYLPFDPFNSCRIRYSFCHEDFDCCSNSCVGSYFTYPFYPYCEPPTDG